MSSKSLSGSAEFLLVPVFGMRHGLVRGSDSALAVQL